MHHRRPITISFQRVSDILATAERTEPKKYFTTGNFAFKRYQNCLYFDQNQCMWIPLCMMPHQHTMPCWHDRLCGDIRSRGTLGSLVCIVALRTPLTQFLFVLWHFFVLWDLSNPDFTGQFWGRFQTKITIVVSFSKFLEIDDYITQKHFGDPLWGLWWPQQCF